MPFRRPRLVAATAFVLLAVCGPLVACSDDPDDPIVARGVLVGDAGESVRADLLLLVIADGPSEVGQTVEVPEVARVRSDGDGEFTFRLDPSDPALRGLIAHDGVVNFQIAAFDSAGRQWHCAFSRATSDGIGWSGLAPDLVLRAFGGCDANAAGASSPTAPPA